MACRRRKKVLSKRVAKRREEEWERLFPVHRDRITSSLLKHPVPPLSHPSNRVPGCPPSWLLLKNI